MFTFESETSKFITIKLSILFEIAINALVSK